MRESQHFWKKTAIRSARDLSAVSAVAAVLAGVGSVYFGRKFGYVKPDEAIPMVIIGVTAGVGAILLEFLFRLLFITPGRIHGENLSENEALRKDVHRLSTVSNLKMLEIEWASVDLGNNLLTAPNVMVDIVNTGEITLDYVGAQIIKIESEDAMDTGDMPKFPLSLIPGPNKKSLDPTERLTVGLCAAVISNPSYTERRGPYAVLRLSLSPGVLSNSWFSFHVNDRLEIAIAPTAKDTKIPVQEYYLSCHCVGPDSDPEYYQLRATKI